MKKFVLLAAASLLLSSCGATSTTSAPGKVVSCAGIAESSQGGTQLPCLDGNSTISYEAIKGPAVINVWGSWCGPCIQEIPNFVKLSATKKVTIIGIDVEEKNMAAGKKFVLGHGMDWPILYDEKSATKSIFGMGVPVTWFKDASGKIVYKKIGTIHTEQELFDLVHKYLGIAV